MTTNKTIQTFLNDAEGQIIHVLKEQELYDETIELIVLPSIKEQVEKILTNQTGADITELSLSFL